jgi:DNA repair protein RadC
MAHKLLNEFGSLSGVFDAKVHEIEKIVGKGGARLIKLIMPIAKRYYLDRENYAKVFTSPSDIGNYVVNYFIGETFEKIILLCFDAKLKLLNVTQIAEGNVSSCNINNRLVCETALKYNASMVVLAHNHPGGIALPSREDMMLTKDLSEFLDTLDIELFDHIVVGNRDFVSFRDSNMMRF